MNIVKINASHVYCTGDIHGNFNSIGYHIKKYDIHDALIVFCGDIGFGFNKLEYYKQTFKSLGRTLSKHNVYLIFIRGNHDDKTYFDSNTIYNKRIKAVEDYTIVQVYPIDDKEYLSLPYNILCVGGATSIDRTYRKAINSKYATQYMTYHGVTLDEAKIKAKKCYWADEFPVFDRDKLNEIKDNDINIDAVATHTCPSFCQPTTKDGITYWMDVDKELRDDLDNERLIMDKLYNNLKADKHTIGVWCYGHYHFHNSEIIDNVRYYLLDMERNSNMDMVEIHNNTL